MAIERTADTDDDGSGTTGTIVDVAWKDALYDQIDEAVGVEQTTTSTGNINDFDLNGEWTILRCTGAAPMFRGFSVKGAAPTAGCRVTIVCLGTTAKVAHQDGTATAAYRAIFPSAQGQIVGVNGVITLVYDGTTDRWRMDSVEPGAMIDVAFSAGNFTANGAMTWTVASGDQSTYAYHQRGDSLELCIKVLTSTVGGTPDTSLRVAIPGGFTQSKFQEFPAYVSDNGTPGIGLARIGVTTQVVEFRTPSLGNWAAATDTTEVNFNGLIPIS